MNITYPKKLPSLPPGAALHVRGLQAHHARRAVLHDINLAIPQGEVTIIIGPNGCGKSTLLRCMARLHKPSRGEVLLGSQNVWRMSQKQTALKLALLPQLPQAPEGIRVGELVGFGRHPHQSWWQKWRATDQRAVDKALDDCDVTSLAQLPLESLSGGQRQRCWLAMVLAQETPLLLLDEPSSMLDPGHQLDLLQRARSLAEQGHSVVIVLHDVLAAARYADHLIAMQAGRIVASGKPNEILTPALLKTLYGVEADLLRTPGEPYPIPVFRRANQQQLGQLMPAQFPNSENAAQVLPSTPTKRNSQWLFNFNPDLMLK